VTGFLLLVSLCKFFHYIISPLYSLSFFNLLTSAVYFLFHLSAASMPCISRIILLTLSAIMPNSFVSFISTKLSQDFSPLSDLTAVPYLTSYLTSLPDCSTCTLLTLDLLSLYYSLVHAASTFTALLSLLFSSSLLTFSQTMVLPISLSAVSTFTLFFTLLPYLILSMAINVIFCLTEIGSDLLRLLLNF